MARPSKSRCPACDAPVEPDADRCAACGEPLGEERIAEAPRPRRQDSTRRRDDEPRVRRWRGEDDLDRPRRRSIRREDHTEASDLLIPTNVSAWAIGSCYLGLVGMCLPLIGFPLCVVAFIFGLLALRQWKRGQSYGAVTSNVRAILGLVFSSIGMLLWGALLVVLLLRA
jgi:hypothetical protein